MASSRGTSNGPDLLDFTETMKAYQEQNSIVIKCMLSLETLGGHTDLVAVMEAWGEDLGEPEAKLLVSVKSICSATKFKSLDVALFRALYALDSQLAWLEMGKPDRRT